MPSLAKIFSMIQVVVWCGNNSDFHRLTQNAVGQDSRYVMQRRKKAIEGGGLALISLVNSVAATIERGAVARLCELDNVMNSEASAV